ncbi:unnamed protein product [Taenia asiatica]|uniref:T-box domain-containing protein n=1 Tax=Taenia asiatica TaxID=60517 RepID=A0A0R3VZ97_TAEAS|nr:unnamed protein product [Taenia asiatica]
MARASREGDDYGGDAVSAEARVRTEEDMHLALLTVARRIPHFLPIDLNFKLSDFSSTCVAGWDYDLAYFAQRPTITLRLHDQAAWQAANPCLMEMRIGGRIFPKLSVHVEGLLAHGLYTIFLDLMTMGQNVYKYRNGLWTPFQNTKPYPPPNQAHHYSSQIFVHRGQVYLPRYHIVRHLTAEEVAVRQYSAEVCGNAWLARLEYIGTYVIPGTAFVAVSDYYCGRIANLKLKLRRGFVR